MNVLVTGGAGYIGTHTCVELLKAGYELTVVDNLVNSKVEAVKRVEEISGKNISFYQVDLMNKAALLKIFKENQFDSVIHFAGLKSVGESVKTPLQYYNNNITGTLNLLEIMNDTNVKKLVFSSSATVYGMPETVPMSEDFPLSATNPYGRTKLMIEEILRDAAVSDETWKISILRYFNPVGAHESGRIGEDPNGIPNNLMPYITQVAIGKLKQLEVYGNDYNTPDGTGIRDYIHVVDLAKGHLKALEKVEKTPGACVYNLGTGTGYSVLDMIKAFEKASGRKIPYKISPRRPGDIAQSYALPTKALTELGWSAVYGIERMCEDSWRWQVTNPKGYE